jgi:hypothetical protein
MKRRIVPTIALAVSATLGSASWAVAHSHADADEARGAPIRMTVFKDPNCGCCKSWVDYMRKHGFEVTVRDTSDVAGVKRTARLPDRLASCHTAFVNGYVVEGHVPAEDVQRMLDQKPRIAGIATPGMPAGSPGMEVPDRKDAYDVIAFKRDGSTSVYAKH